MKKYDKRSLGKRRGPLATEEDNLDNSFDTSHPPLHEDLTLFDLGRTIEPQISVAVIVQERLQNIQHLGHLGEDENAMMTRFQVVEQGRKDLQLATVVLNQTRLGKLDERLPVDQVHLRRRRTLNRLEEVGRATGVENEQIEERLMMIFVHLFFKNGRTTRSN